MNLNSVHFKFALFLTSGIEQGLARGGGDTANFRACVFDGSGKVQCHLLAETIIHLLGRLFTVPGTFVHNMSIIATPVQKERGNGKIRSLTHSSRFVPKVTIIRS